LGRRVRVSTRIRFAGDDLIVFLHGLGCAKESFDAAFDAPTLVNFSICSFDFPGYGGSSRYERSLYSLPEFADIINLVVERLVKDLSPRRVFLVGHSMGGAVSLIARSDQHGVLGPRRERGAAEQLSEGVVSGQQLGGFGHGSTADNDRVQRDMTVVFKMDQVL
jgi:Alpha/beta hydrolase family